MSTAYPGPHGGQNNRDNTPTEGQAFPADQQGQAYPAYGNPMYQNGLPQAPVKERNTIGIIALVCAILGVIFSCIPGFLILGWILLPISFILGLVGLFPKDKKKGTAIAAVITSIVGAVVAAVAFMFVIDSAFNDAFNEETTVSNNGGANAVGDGDSAEGNSEDSADGAADGATRENPLPIGATVSTDEWDVTVNSVDLNATDAVMSENPVNDAPADGQTYVMANVTAKYKGDDPQGSMPTIGFAFVTPEGNTINSYDSIVIAPDYFDQSTTLYKDAEETGNFAFLVDEATAADSVLAVSPDMFAQNRFVAVK